MYLIRRDFCFLNTAKSLFPLWSEETRKAALWFQDVCPRFEVYLTTICICFLQQSKWWFSLSTYHPPPYRCTCNLLWNDTSLSGESTAVGMIHGGRLWDTGRPLKILSTSFHSWWTTSRKLDRKPKVYAYLLNGESRSRHYNPTLILNVTW